MQARSKILLEAVVATLEDLPNRSKQLRELIVRYMVYDCVLRGKTYGTTVSAIDVTQQSLDVALDLVCEGKVLPVLKVEEEEPANNQIRIPTRLSYTQSTHS